MTLESIHQLLLPFSDFPAEFFMCKYIHYIICVLCFWHNTKKRHENGVTESKYEQCKPTETETLLFAVYPMKLYWALEKKVWSQWKTAVPGRKQVKSYITLLYCTSLELCNANQIIGRNTFVRKMTNVLLKTDEEKKHCFFSIFYSLLFIFVSFCPKYLP